MMSGAGGARGGAGAGGGGAGDEEEGRSEQEIRRRGGARIGFLKDNISFLQIREFWIQWIIIETSYPFSSKLYKNHR